MGSLEDTIKQDIVSSWWWSLGGFSEQSRRGGRYGTITRRCRDKRWAYPQEGHLPEITSEVRRNYSLPHGRSSRGTQSKIRLNCTQSLPSQLILTNEQTAGCSRVDSFIPHRLSGLTLQTWRTRKIQSISPVFAGAETVLALWRKQTSTHSLCGAKSQGQLKRCAQTLGRTGGQGQELCETEMMAGESMGTGVWKHTGHFGEGGKASVTSWVDGRLLGLWFSAPAAH